MVFTICDASFGSSEAFALNGEVEIGKVALGQKTKRRGYSTYRIEVLVYPATISEPTPGS